MLEPDKPDNEDLMDEPWDGPSELPEKEEPVEVNNADDRKPVGANELRIVRGIEDSLRNKNGPHIQVIKSRDIANARSFSNKVFRVLKMHGYKIHDLNIENIDSPLDEDETESVTVFSIDEITMRQFLGKDLETVSSPIQYIFNNSMLSGVRNPMLISTVSDEFYDRSGLKAFTNFPEEQEHSAKKPVRTASTGTSYRSGSMYLVAAAFLASGLNTVAGNFLTFNYASTLYTPLPFIVFIFSIAAIAIRAFGLNAESKRSAAMVISSISIFIALFVLGEVLPYYAPAYAAPFLDTAQALFHSQPSIILPILAVAVLLVSLSRYILFLGDNSGRPSLFLAIAGVAMILAVLFISMEPYITIFNTPVNRVVSPGALVAFSRFTYLPYFPIFGTSTFFNITGEPQYLFARNYIILAANLILAVAFLLSARNGSHVSARASKQ